MQNLMRRRVLSKLRKNKNKILKTIRTGAAEILCEIFSNNILLILQLPTELKIAASPGELPSN